MGIHIGLNHTISICPVWEIGNKIDETEEYPKQTKLVFLEIFKRILSIFMNIKQRWNRRAITTKYGKYKIAAV